MSTGPQDTRGAHIVDKECVFIITEARIGFATRRGPVLIVLERTLENYMISQIQQISLDLIDPPVIAMRSTSDDDTLPELMASIKEHGLMQPVTLVKKGERYEVIAGARRFRAFQLLKHATIPSIVRELDDETAETLKIHENFMRRELDIIEEACYIGELITQKNYTIARIAELRGRSEQYVRDRLAVFDMPEIVQGYIKAGQLSLGAALHLSTIINPNERTYYFNYAAMNGVSVLQAKYWAARLNMATPLNPINAEQLLADSMQTEYEPKQISCAKCTHPCLLTEADTVFVHRNQACPVG